MGTLQKKAADRFDYIPILVFLILTLAIVLSGYLHFRQHVAEMRYENISKLAAVSELKVRSINVWRKERIGDVTSIVASPILAGRRFHLLSDPAEQQRRQEVARWFDLIRKQYEYDRIYLVSEMRLLLSSAEGESRPDGKVFALAAEAVRSGDVVFSDIVEGDMDGSPRILLARVIPETGKDGSSAGVLVFSIDPSRFLYPLIQFWPTDSPSAETLIVRREGDSALFLNELRHRHNSALKMVVPLSETGVIAVKAIRGELGETEGLDYRGERVIAFTQAVPDTSWIVVTKKDTAEVDVPIRNEAINMIIFQGSLVLVAGLVIMVLWVQIRRRNRLLAGSEHRLNESQRMAHLGSWERDMIDDSAIWSDEMFRIAGLPVSTRAPLFDEFIAMVHPEDRGELKSLVARAVDERQPFATEYRIITPSGEEKHLLSVAEPMSDKKGRTEKLCGMILDITERKRYAEERETLIRGLQEALLQVRRLSGLLPICSACKKIRDDKGYWQQVEVYIHDHSDADFTHSICPECAKRLYGDYLDEDAAGSGKTPQG